MKDLVEHMLLSWSFFHLSIGIGLEGVPSMRYAQLPIKLYRLSAVYI